MQETLPDTRTWTGKRLTACQAQPDLVAVYESGDGVFALLLRHTIVPLAEERRLWYRATRRAANAIIGHLRRVNLDGRFVVLQWLPLDEVACILGQWTRRYEGDAERRARIARVVEGRLADRAFLTRSRAIRDELDGWGREERAETPVRLRAARGLAWGGPAWAGSVVPEHHAGLMGSRAAHSAGARLRKRAARSSTA